MDALKSQSPVLARIADEWDRAERDIKLAEQVCGAAVIPAIAELRYAGRRLVDCLRSVADGEPAARTEGLVQDALLNCVRARHDAIDASIARMAEHVRLMVERLGHHAVAQAFPEFAAFQTRLDDAHGLIAESRGERRRREDIYTALEEAGFPPLVAEYRRLKNSEKIMESHAALSLKRERLGWFREAFVAVLGTLLAFLAGLALR